MQRLEVSGAVRPIYGSLGVKRLSIVKTSVNQSKLCLSSFIFYDATTVHT